jgi:hypothetical protein
VGEGVSDLAAVATVGEGVSGDFNLGWITIVNLGVLRYHYISFFALQYINKFQFLYLYNVGGSLLPHLSEWVGRVFWSILDSRFPENSFFQQYPP